MRNFAFGFNPQRGQRVLGGRALDEAGLSPALRVGEQHQARVGIIEAGAEDEPATATELEGERVGGAIAKARSGPGIGLIVGVVALNARIGQVDRAGPMFVQTLLVVDAKGHDIGFTEAGVVADDALHTRKCASRDEPVLSRVAGLQRGAAPGERQFDPAQNPGVLELRVEGVNGGMGVCVRFEFQRADDRGPLKLTALDIGLGAAEQQVACANGRITPGIPAFALSRGRLRCEANREADRVVRELVDVKAGDAVAAVFRAGVQGAVLVPLIAPRNGDRLFVAIQRANGAQVGGAGEALAHELGVGRFINDNRAQQFGRVLIKFDAAIVAGGDLFAAVQQRGGEVRTKAANRDHLGATAQALGGETGQASQGLGDRVVRQAADVLCRDGFDDRGRFPFHGDRAFDGAAEAGHGDHLTGCFLSLVLARSGCGHCHGQGQRGCRAGQKPAATRGALIGHSVLPPACRHDNCRRHSTAN